MTITLQEVTSFATFQRSFIANAQDFLSRHDRFYRVDLSRDELSHLFLEAFPEGENGEVRQSFNCNACKSFVRDLGGLVAINTTTYQKETLWDFAFPQDAVYNDMLVRMSSFIKATEIRDLFLTSEASFGVNQNTQYTETGVISRHHLYVEWPREKRTVTRYGETLEQKRSLAGDAKRVLQRLFNEISLDSLDTIGDLMAMGSLYRGDQFAWQLEAVKNLFEEYLEIFQLVEDYNLYMLFQEEGSLKDLDNESVIDHYKEASRRGYTSQTIDNWLWNASRHEAVAKTRNSALGTLISNINNIGKSGSTMTLDKAVRAWERVVGGESYMRPKNVQLVTPKMITDAEKALEDLGLTKSLGRRLAVYHDVPIGWVLFADREVREQKIQGGIFDQLREEATVVQPKTLSGSREISLAEFQTNLSMYKSIEVLLESRHTPKMVSLIAPQDMDAPSLTPWNNGFTLFYNGGYADSLISRVREAGGKVDGDINLRLGWNDISDLDAHLYMANNYHLYFRDRGQNVYGWTLDVDANGGTINTTTKPVENITLGRKQDLVPGIYRYAVNQYNPRNIANKDGFFVELDLFGDTYTFVHETPMTRKSQSVEVVKFKVDANKNVEILESLPYSKQTNTIWGLQTNQWHRVSMVTEGPNSWDGEPIVGNRHVLFMLEGCVNDSERIRGFFNEFLKPELSKHRRVLELLGRRLDVAQTTPEMQLSGLGFSTGLRDEASSLYVRVTTKSNVQNVVKVVV